MRTPMLPLVNVVRGNRLLAGKPVDTSFAPITDILDFYSRDLAAESGHALMIRETGYALNYSKLNIKTSMEIGG